MNTHPAPRHRAIRLIALPLVATGCIAGAIVLAQDPAPVAAPAPVVPPAPIAPAPAALPAPAPIALPTPAPGAPRPVAPPTPGALPGPAAFIAPGSPPAGLDAPVPLPPSSGGRAVAPRQPIPGSPGGVAGYEEGRLGPSIRQPIPGAPGASAGAGANEMRPARSMGPARARGRTTRNLANALVNEEVSADPQDAIRNYEAMIADFDSQREDAARAVFRLGEAYRKLGRIEEARVRFARILREFVDFPELTRLSQQQLAQSGPQGLRGGGVISDLPPASSAEERGLLHDELGLLQAQMDRMQELVKTGVAPETSLFPIQREILHLKQQLARLGNAGVNPPPARQATPSRRGPPPSPEGADVPRALPEVEPAAGAPAVTVPPPPAAPPPPQPQ